jgi:GNAT superfamily N-acetyltransferase
VLQRVTPEAEDARAFAERAGQSEWSLEFDGRVVGNGAILFHYNHPYCDLAMEIVADHRRRGLGAYFVQELKRRAYALGGIPAARCSPDNIASRRTLQKAGFVPYAHMIVGKLSLV